MSIEEGDPNPAQTELVKEIGRTAADITGMIQEWRSQSEIQQFLDAASNERQRTRPLSPREATERRIHRLIHPEWHLEGRAGDVFANLIWTGLHFPSGDYYDATVNPKPETTPFRTYAIETKGLLGSHKKSYKVQRDVVITREERNGATQDIRATMTHTYDDNWRIVAIGFTPRDKQREDMSLLLTLHVSESRGGIVGHKLDRVDAINPEITSIEKWGKEKIQNELGRWTSIKYKLSDGRAIDLDSIDSSIHPKI